MKGAAGKAGTKDDFNSSLLLGMVYGTASASLCGIGGCESCAPCSVFTGRQG